MNAIQMPLALNMGALLGAPAPSTYIEIFLGLTAWKRSGDDPPEFVGWYRTWEGEGKPATRRYYNGHLWSLPVTRYMSDEMVDVKSAYFEESSVSDAVIWCGLCKPHLVGYFQPLVVSDRTRRVLQSRE